MCAHLIPKVCSYLTAQALYPWAICIRHSHVLIFLPPLLFNLYQIDFRVIFETICIRAFFPPSNTFGNSTYFFGIVCVCGSRSRSGAGGLFPIRRMDAVQSTARNRPQVSCYECKWFSSAVVDCRLVMNGVCNQIQLLISSIENNFTRSDTPIILYTLFNIQ